MSHDEGLAEKVTVAKTRKNLKTYTHKTIEADIGIADEAGGVPGAHRRGKKQIEEYCAEHGIKIIGGVSNSRTENNRLTCRATIAVRDD